MMSCIPDQGVEAMTDLRTDFPYDQVGTDEAIIVTGAAGKTGRAVIAALSARGRRVRAFVRRPEQGAIARAAGAQEVVVGDLRDAEAVGRALGGGRELARAHAIYHICPNMSPDELAIGECVIAAAVAAATPRFVYHSVLHPQTEKMPHHWQKLRVEERLFESGLDFTILQPAVYMQNILAAGEAILQQGRYPIPYAASTRLSFVDLDDVAEVATRALLEPGHAGAIYELAGTTALSQTAIAAILSEQVGRTVAVEVIARDAWERQAAAAGLNAYAVTTLLQMFAYYEACGFAGNPNVLRWLLGREPTSLEAFAARQLASPARQGEQ